MIILNSAAAVRQGPTRPQTTPRSEPGERFPHEAYRETLEIAGPTVSQIATSSVRGLGEGLSYGATVGAALSFPASLLMIRSAFNPGLGVLAGIAFGALLGGVGMGLAGALKPWGDERRAERHHQEIGKVVRSGDLSLEESKTARLWSQIDSAKPLDELNAGDLDRLGGILKQMKTRGLRLNERLKNAPKQLAAHKLWVNENRIDSLDELKLLDATTGGGLAILSQPQREAVELLAGMAHRGFEIGRTMSNGVLELYSPSSMAARVYESGFQNDSQPLDPPLQVRHSSGQSVVHTIAELRQLDGGGTA